MFGRSAGGEPRVSGKETRPATRARLLAPLSDHAQGNKMDKRVELQNVDDEGRLERSRRRFLKQMAAAGVGIAVASEVTQGRRQAPDSTLYAYPARASIIAGEKLRLHYWTKQNYFKVSLYRQGVSLVPASPAPEGVGAWVPRAQELVDVPFGPLGHSDATSDWNWPYVEYTIPADWKPGVYIAMFHTSAINNPSDGGTPPDKGVETPDGANGKVLFVVKNPNPGSTTNILYKVPLTTYHAYNQVSAAGNYVSSLYVNPQGKTTDGHTGYKVTLLRPGGGTGGCPSPLTYQLDPSTPLNSFAHWDARMISWLEASVAQGGGGYTVDYCTDLDVHLNPEMLNRYALLLSVGHDEYWSQRMRDNVEAFVRRGGNITFFSGNTSFWRIHFTDLRQGLPTSFVCEKRCLGAPTSSCPCSREGFEGADIWWRLNRPENNLTGVSIRNAGDSVAGVTQPKGGYTLQHADAADCSWVFKGDAALSSGTVLGEAEGLVGYECDGAQYTGTSIKEVSTKDGTPSNFVILGYCPTPGDATGSGGRWRHYPRETDSCVDNGSDRAATMGYYTNVGTVFTGATTDWARVLKTDNAQVKHLTNNLLAGLSTPLTAVAVGRLGAAADLAILFQNSANAQPLIWYVNNTTVRSSRYTYQGRETLEGMEKWSLKAGAGSQFFFQNKESGKVAAWTLDDQGPGKLKLTAGQPSDPGAGWRLVTAADFAGNGVVDFVYENSTTRNVSIRYGNSGTCDQSTTEISSPHTNPAGWTLVAAVNTGGANRGLVYQHEDGSMFIFYVGCGSISGSTSVRQLPDPLWRLVGAGDFNGDRVSDLLFQHRVTNELMVWYMSYNSSPPGPANDKILGSPITVGDGAGGSVAAVPTRGRTPVGNGSRPSALTARVVAPNSVLLSWVPPETPVSSYEIERVTEGPALQLTPVSATETTRLDALPAGGAVRTYQYRVRAISNGQTSAFSNTALVTAVVFTDTPLAPGSTVIKRAHLSELRQAVDALRRFAGLLNFDWGETNPYQPPMRKVVPKDIQDLRTAIDAAYVELGYDVQPYPSNPPLEKSKPVAAAHFEQIRERVRRGLF